LKLSAPRLALAATCLSAALAIAAWWALRPRPTLERVGPLARAGQFDQALETVDEYLRAYPDDPRGRLTAAELALNMPNPRPELALEHLGRLATEDPALAAAGLLDEGKAAYLLEQYDRAESCWRRALERDPGVPEAAWALLDLDYLEGRVDEARRVALRQYAIEPDRQDQARMLLELVRQDAEPPDPISVAGRFAPAVRQHPEEFRASVALGLALVHSARPDEGLAILREAVLRRPDDPDAWDALLTGLDDAFRPEELATEVGRLPPALAGDPRLEKHRGRAAQVRGDWAAAALAYRRAHDARPHDLAVMHRLDDALRRSGDLSGARELEGPMRSAQAARDEVAGLFAEAMGKSDFGRAPDPDLYRRLAENRERLGRRDEARAWHLLILRDIPYDPASIDAAERLK
jgi:tetratricopeptide (TPR) repeat protein